jgi:hypothetical protein
MNKSDSIKEISAALLKAQSEMGGAVKGAANPFFRSKFADLNSIREAVIPVLNKHGITVLQPTTVVDGRSFVETTLLHESGQYLTSLTEIICAKPNDPQAHGSGVSYSRRYGLQAFLCVASVDDDAESAMGRSKGLVETKVTAGSVNTASTAPTVQNSTTTEVPARRASFRSKVTTPVSTTSTASDDI